MTKSLEKFTDLITQANALVKSGHLKEAVDSFEKALEIDSKHYETWVSLSQLHYKLGQYRKAIQADKAAEKYDPLEKDFQHIQHAMQARQYNQASTLAHHMLAQYPYHPRAVFTLSHLYAMRGAHEDSAALLQKSLESAPSNTVLRQMLVKAFENCGAFQDAIATAKHIVDIEPSFVNIWELMGVYLRHGYNEDLLAVSDMAYNACRDDKAKRSEIDLLCGQALKILGRREDSIHAFKACLNNKPESGTAWWALADMKDYHFTESDTRKMRAVIETVTIPPDQKMQACFALAKALELEGDLKKAMVFYNKGNAFRGGRGFDAHHYGKAIVTIKQAFTPKVLSQQGHTQKTEPTPIFIVGMPRSGSTLIEQILASHSQIEGTIEMLVLPSVKRKAHITCGQQFSGSYLENIGKLSTSQLRELGRDYLEMSKIYRKESKPFFIDKLPYNFEHIGLIHKILPHALIIDARRNPMDCGFSIFKQYFSAGANYSYDLENIGAYYKGYLELMDHWDNALPNKIIHVQYEELVHNTKIKVQDILSYIGVDYEENCLRFYENKRAVRTASSEQVRKPIYTKSIDAWQAVKGELGPLNKSLGAATLKRFERYLSPS